MKKLSAILVLAISPALVFSQTTSPDINGEYCPLTNITFNVTLPIANFVSLSSWTNNPVVVNGITNLVNNTNSGTTTFSFVGQLRDVNIAQTFKVNYTPSNGSATDYFITIKKIKSLFYGSTDQTACPGILPNINSITAPPCTITNTAISFPTIKWFTYAENPSLCWGSIATYEYQLPAGWSIGSSVSTGSNWIQGSNSVTVTSDLNNGGVIRIRPANSCGAGLANGVTPAVISISRPKPTLTFTGGSTVCTVQNFQALNVPGWVNGFNWSVTPSSVFSITNPNSNPTTVTKVSSGEGDIQLVISSSTCPATFTYNTLEITGKPKLVAGIPEAYGMTPLLALYNAPGDENDICRYQGTDYDFNYTSNSTVTWSAVSHLGGPWPSWNQSATDDLYVEFFTGTQVKLVMKVDVANTCGTSSYQFGFKAVDCSGFRTAKANKFVVSPNPTTGLINITQDDKQVGVAIEEVKLSDANNNVLRIQKFPKLTTAQVNVGNLHAGAYYITIKSSTYQETQTVIKK
jgi:Secretion system C-terminal sorting domain